MIKIEVMVMVNKTVATRAVTAKIDIWKFMILFSEWGINITVNRSLPFLTKRSHPFLTRVIKPLRWSIINFFIFS